MTEIPYVVNDVSVCPLSEGPTHGPAEAAVKARRGLCIRNSFPLSRTSRRNKGSHLSNGFHKKRLMDGLSRPSCSDQWRRLSTPSYPLLVFTYTRGKHNAHSYLAAQFCRFSLHLLRRLFITAFSFLFFGGKRERIDDTCSHGAVLFRRSVDLYS